MQPQVQNAGLAWDWPSLLPVSQAEAWCQGSPSQPCNRNHPEAPSLGPSQYPLQGRVCPGTLVGPSLPQPEGSPGSHSLGPEPAATPAPPGLVSACLATAHRLLGLWQELLLGQLLRGPPRTESGPADRPVPDSMLPPPVVSVGPGPGAGQRRGRGGQEPPACRPPCPLSPARKATETEGRRGRGRMAGGGQPGPALPRAWDRDTGCGGGEGRA